MKRAISFAALVCVVTASAPTANAIDRADGSGLAAFGAAVAMVGDAAFVGEARGGIGAVHLYRRLPTGNWKTTGKITAPNGLVNDGFGVSLATDGSTLLVGQVGPLNAADSGRGTVQVFTRGPDGNWKSAGIIGEVGQKARAGFGTAIALRGDLAFVGAPGEAAGGTVYLFRRGADGKWTAAGSIAPDGGVAAGDRFGASISVDGDRAAVGAPGRESKGKIYTFVKGAEGSWKQEAALVGRRTLDNSTLGAAIHLKGDRLLAGSPTANAFSGGATLFEKSKDTPWVEKASFSSFEGGAVRFGTAVAIGDKELWVGSPAADAGMGRIFRIALDKDGIYTGMNKLVVDSMPLRGTFGNAFAVSGNNAIVGMSGDGGGLGTVMFLTKGATGNWTMKGTSFPPVVDKWPGIAGGEVKCENGMAKEWECGNTGVLAFMPISAIGGKRGTMISGNWGWTDAETGRDYALIGRNDGTSFVDVTDPTRPRYLGEMPLPKTAQAAIWKEMKTLGHYALVVGDNSAHHGIQIFDLHRLRNVKTPQVFQPDAWYDALYSIHDIMTNDGSGFAYAVGSNGGGETCGGGYHMIDMRNPLKPVFVGCFADPKTGRSGTGYTHDGLCRMYHGPDARYTGKEICVGSNETALSISDVTDKKNPVILSRATYPDVGYTHQGWWTEDMRYFYVNDELDETSGKGDAAKATRTLIFDMAKLDDPVFVGPFLGTTKASDHNLYVKGNRMYQSNYMAGLRIIDVTDPAKPREVGFFDVAPGENTPGFSGSWNNYPFFKNGSILVNNMQAGIFLIKDRTQAIP
ncbi:MAG: choice-of-anchor B family protein [Vicinamibacterales bacterium]